MIREQQRLGPELERTALDELSASRDGVLLVEQDVGRDDLRDPDARLVGHAGSRNSGPSGVIAHAVTGVNWASSISPRTMR